METEKELIKAVFDFMIKVVEINKNSNEKHNAVLNQDFELASELRKKGTELALQLPSIESMKELRAKLD